ncbi:hypothetical protein BO71DRAFT_402217 [Aspergillus ellipticus CBS 707.79]|uniref:MOSC domain-containing protein n=1 Tax=Aspergillus ellipticus CBS 707.79 TaxID=1448320 RepID=A0A319CZB2_9EURO|nr:hypothetical protein BO71DRAFT_402217 [Aspergillus ellipticus CBS 707.79]
MESSTLLTLSTLLLLLSIPLLLPRFTGWTQASKSSLLQKLHASQQPTPPKATSEIVSLRVYPIKSCRGFSIPRTQLRLHGLELDRRWMFVDATTHDFLTIRQIPQMTLINTGLSPDGTSLLLSITNIPHKTISIPARPDPAWLATNTTLAQVTIWDTTTDGYIYGPGVNSLFSTFLGREVALAYKGPTPRILKGNGHPRLLGREQSTNFPDVHPILIASEASIAELNARLRENGADPITVERFRPNIVIKGDVPWSEDSWKLVRITNPADGVGDRRSALDLDVVARCARCQVPNVDPDTADKHRKQPWDTLMSYRRVDEGMKYKPCFGMLSAPRNEGVVEVGMRFEVLEETSQHRYITGF